MRDLSPYERVALARDAKRPYTLDLIEALFTDFTELSGDRCYADDSAIVAGTAKFREKPVMVIGHQKGRQTQERKLRNFGMPKPEGYRKALRLMKLAEKSGRPILTFIDTPGAYPGIDAEERGQAEAIAHNLLEMAMLQVPIITVVIGEGGSGGALGIGVCDRLIMLENAIYSVISPEGCAAILWKNSSYVDIASQCLKLTATDLKAHKIAESVIEEPMGYAYDNLQDLADKLAGKLEDLLKDTCSESVQARTLSRYSKLKAIGLWQC